MGKLTKLEGVPDSEDDVIPGMAYLPGTGPPGKTCGDCKHRGLTREGKKLKWNEGLQQLVPKMMRTAQCAMFKKLAMRYGVAVKKRYPACKYFEPKAK